MSIQVMWWGTTRETWSCVNVLNGIFDLYKCEHYTRLEPPPDDNCAIIVFHGHNLCRFGNGEHNAGEISQYARRFQAVIFVSVGDEATEFPLHLLEHTNHKLWVQAPLPTTKADRYLIQGWPSGTRRIADIKKNMDFAFCGQNTHQRRRECIAAMQEIRGDHNVVLGTDGFGKGMDQFGYLVTLSVAKMAPCPAGSQTPDTFRVYEALECGAIPILDAVSLRPETRGVWPLLLGDHPLPVIEDWATLPDVMAEWLTNWEEKSRWIQAWWKSYKTDMHLWLARDLISLGVANGRKEEASASSAATP